MKKIDPWLSDNGVTDILFNGMESCYTDGREGLQLRPHPFSKSEFDNFVEWLLVQNLRTIDVRRPAVDGQLPDGSRFHIIRFPATRSGPFVSIRKFLPKDFAVVSIPGNWHTKLKTAVLEKKNILIVGPTGAGKTTLLSMLAKEIPHGERILLIEDASELHFDHPHLLKLEGRAGGLDGIPEISLSFLLKNAFRMRPDRILLGECRGGEAWEFLQILQSGHRGAMTTLHAFSGESGLLRLESLALNQNKVAQIFEIRQQFADQIDLVCLVEKTGWERRLARVWEVEGGIKDAHILSPWSL